MRRLVILFVVSIVGVLCFAKYTVKGAETDAQLKEEILKISDEREQALGKGDARHARSHRCGRYDLHQLARRDDDEGATSGRRKGQEPFLPNKFQTRGCASRHPRQYRHRDRSQLDECHLQGKRHERLAKICERVCKGKRAMALRPARRDAGGAVTPCGPG